MPRNVVTLTTEQEREIIALYRSGTPLNEIKPAYDLNNDSRIYAILKRYSEPTRTRSGKAAPTVTRVPYHKPSEPLEITTDSNGLVEHVVRHLAPHKNGVYEVIFTSALRIEADSFEDALAETRKLPYCRSIQSVHVVK
jgi:hypothetical protein